MREIPLNSNLVAYVDDEDYELIAQHRWWAEKSVYTHYATCQVYRDGKRTTLKMHRLILGANDKRNVDHIDRDGLNNTRQNLRYATHSQNQHNRPAQANNTSGYKGVSWDKKLRRWSTRIMVNGRHLGLGRHESVIEAAKAYDEAAAKYFGEFAHFNLRPNR